MSDTRPIAGFNFLDGLLRVWWGPTVADRMLAAQLFGTTGTAAMLLLAEGMFVQRNFLEYRPQWAGFTITMIEVALTVSIALILTMLFSCTLPTNNESDGVKRANFMFA